MSGSYVGRHPVPYRLSRHLAGKDSLAKQNVSPKQVFDVHTRDVSFWSLLSDTTFIKHKSWVEYTPSVHSKTPG